MYTIIHIYIHFNYILHPSVRTNQTEHHLYELSLIVSEYTHGRQKVHSPYLYLTPSSHPMERMGHCGDDR